MQAIKKIKIIIVQNNIFEFRRHTTWAQLRDQCETVVLSKTNDGVAYDFMQRKIV